MHQESNRSGLVAGGNWIIDNLKLIDKYPSQNTLANITSEALSNGGSPYNILKNLALLGCSFPLKGVGLIGKDKLGERIKEDCVNHGINISGIKTIPEVPTAYTDVMIVVSSGGRTFFHQRGANAFLDVSHFEFRKPTEKIFHLGYLLLLDSLDKISEDGTTGAGRVLEAAYNSGYKTSVDLVSEDSDRFKMIIFPSLTFVHYIFMNEFEAAKCTDLDLSSEELSYKSLDSAATTILEGGVREWVFIHFPAGVFAKNKIGEVLVQGSVNLPKERIVSSVGAGDALAAGILYAIHENWSMNEALELGVCCAAACLHGYGSSDGILHYKDSLNLGKAYGYRSFDHVNH